MDLNSRKQPVIVVKEFAQIVTDVDAAMFESLGFHVYSDYGPAAHIEKKLMDLKLNNQENYPLIVLVQPFQEKDAGSYVRVKLPKVIIATKTNGTDPTTVRYNDTFEPVLYPIYFEFIRQIKDSKYITLNQKVIDKMDIPGPQTATEKVKDYIDVIEINDLDLTFKAKCS